MANPVHYYHIWAGGDWKIPVHEHFAALRRAEFTGDVRVGFVGTEQQRDEAEHFFRIYCVDSPEFRVTAASGFEQVTLTALHDDVQSLPPGTPVLYAHNKGTLTRGPASDDWRYAMTRALVYGWRRRVIALGNFDAVGLHWLTRDSFEGCDLEDYVGPHFSGNFWWANAGYLAALAAPACNNRYEAEMWVGTGDPKVKDLRPGREDYVNRVTRQYRSVQARRVRG